jgi:hypothetical protein
MTPQLRDGLRDAADQAGTSLNAFAVQVLAAAAGDATVMGRDEGRSTTEVFALAKRLDVEDPGYYVRWEQARAGGDS